MEPDGRRKVAAACVDCGRVFAATHFPDGSTRIIGQPDGCPCGGSEFLLPTDPVSEDSE